MNIFLAVNSVTLSSPEYGTLM
uniref:Uncharacterized protein n=1 Tax=Rhizophora mucronata TaxID=61149 RepID=A0A2P2P8U7_RHIMU